MCSKRRQPFLPELEEVLERHGELNLEGVKEQLCQMSPATIDCLLEPYRHRGVRRFISATKSGSLLKAAIPIRTFAVGYGAKAMTGWVAPFSRWLGGCPSPC